jgi:predicted enzyme related to lactoylglutathione lyase
MVDCADSPGLARFWGAVLERPVEGAGEGFWVSLPDGNQPSGIFFREVRDAKQVKNRLHLDLNHGDGTLAAELKRLTALGATVLARHNRGPGLGWVVLADPEGNEFCVQSSDAEVAAVQERLDAGNDARRQDSPATPQRSTDHFMCFVSQVSPVHRQE